jgi:hypothetical protein
MPAFMRVLAAGVIVVAGGCAHGGMSTSTGQGGEPLRWTGQLQQTEGSSQSAVLSGRVASTRGAYGDIVITTKDTLHALSSVDLGISAPTIGSTQLAWAIFSGPCGAPLPSVAGVNEFPPIEITSGASRVKVDINFALRPGKEYHINVYNSNRASDVSNVMMCAPLRLGR